MVNVGSCEAQAKTGTVLKLSNKLSHKETPQRILHKDI